MDSVLQQAADRHGAEVELLVERAYDGYALTEEDEVVKALMSAARAVGLEPVLAARGGGSDANIFNVRGIQVANVSVGYGDQHSVEEWLAVETMAYAAQLVLEYIVEHTPQK